MLSEEALIVLAAFGACGLLVLGVLELLWPTRSKHPVRERPPAPPTPAQRAHRQSALVRHARGRPSPVRRTPPLAPLPSSLRSDPVSAPAEIAAEPVTAQHADVSPVFAEPVAAEPVVVEAVLVEPAPAEPIEAEPIEVEPTVIEPVAVPPMVIAPVAVEVPVAAPEPPVRIAPVDVVAEKGSLVEACFALYQARQHAEVIERAAGALATAADDTPLTDSQKAALWSVVALARQAMGEDAEAHTALASAIALATAGDRLAYQRQLAALAESVGQRLLDEVRRHGTPASEDGLATLRNAVTWLERGAAAVPGDARLADLVAGAQAMLWPAWERTVMALAQRQDYRGARRLLREAMADDRFPAGHADTFRELFSGTFSGELGQLTAQAIRSMQEARESDALASLQRAETLLDTLHDEALPAARREEVDRRLWWGYNKLGERRVESADHEAALEPLYHALAYDVGPERRQETIALLMRALDGVADARALDIAEHAEAGDHEAALVACDKLWALLRSATTVGLSETELTVTFAKVRRLFESLGRRPST